ncbi:MAG TPA: thioredoxin domain-containing protein [Planctomycetota bacterium]|nr:thioredoxin domain-containing protein [Planctomycetota bacterium]
MGTTFVTVRPPVITEKPAGRPMTKPGRPIFWLAALGAADALYLCYVHLFLSGACATGGHCGSVLESQYGRALGIPLAAYGLGLFAALALAASKRALGWVRLFAVVGALPGPFLVYIQAERLHAWCPFCLVSTALLAIIAILSIRGGRASVDLTHAPGYLAALGLPLLVVAGVEKGLAERDLRRALAPAGPTATIAGERVPLDDVPEVGRLEWEAYKSKLAYVEHEVLKREAAAQGMTVDDLVRRNIDMKVSLPEADILAKWREEGGAGGPMPRETRMRVAASLALEWRPAVEAEYLRGLFEKYDVKVAVATPSARERIPLNPRDGPVKGPADAPLEIVVFSDFACPMCARVYEWLRALDVPARVAYRALPLGPPGPSAFAAAAAHEQGKFFEFADAVFRRHGAVDPSQLEECAAEAGLDLAKFRASLASDAARRVVQEDVDEARALGVQATPTLFVNGVHFVGVPDARLLRAILARDVAKK